MATETLTFPLSLTPATTSTVTELAHFRNIILGTGEVVGIYLESLFLNFSLKSFALMIFPDYDGDETENEKIIKFNAAELQSQKLGLQILTRKDNTGNWREKAEITLTNGSRKSYRDIIKPYLTQGGVRIFQRNDSIGIRLMDYGNGLLKQTDFMEVEACFTVAFGKR